MALEFKALGAVPEEDEVLGSPLQRTSQGVGSGQVCVRVCKSGHTYMCINAGVAVHTCVCMSV